MCHRPAGRRLAIAAFATTPAGYRALLDWAQKLGEVAVFGVEGCGCYGAGLARFLGAKGQLVLEVNWGCPALTDRADGSVRLPA